MRPTTPPPSRPRPSSGDGFEKRATEGSATDERWQRAVCLAASLLVSVTASLGLSGLADLDRLIESSPPMCSGTAAPPGFLREVESSRVILLTSRPEPARSELFFCLQYELVPRPVLRSPAGEPERALGFTDGVAALVFVASAEELEPLLARLAAEAGQATVMLRAEERGWFWFEVARP